MRKESLRQHAKKTVREVSKGLSHLEYGSAVSHSVAPHRDHEARAGQKVRKTAVTSGERKRKPR